MKTAELTLGGDIFDHLKEMVKRCQSSTCPGEQTLAKTESLCSEARKTWASAAFSDLSETSLTRYFSHQLNAVTEVTILLDDISRQFFGSLGNSDIFQSIRCEILSLVNYLIGYYRPYIDCYASCPDVFKQYIVENLSTKVDFVYNSLPKLNDAVQPLGNVVSTYLRHIRSSDHTTVFNFGQVMYFNGFVNDLELFFQNSLNLVRASVFAERLLKLEFNHYLLFIHYQTAIQQRLDSTPLKKRENKLDEELFLLAHKNNPNTLRYDLRWPPLEEMLTGWLLQAKKKLTKSEVAPSSTDRGKSKKMHVILSVSQLAALAKLFVKEKIFGDHSMNEVFEFFSGNFSSKRQDAFSQGNFIKEYYSITQVTAAELRDLLLRMVARINRDFFPAVVAVSFLIRFYQGT